MNAGAASTARTARLRASFDALGIDQLIVTDLVDLRYLTGFTGTAGVAVVDRERAEFITDFRYLEQAARQVTGFTIVDGGDDQRALIASKLRDRVGFDPEHTTFAAHGRLAKAVAERAELVAVERPIATLRMVKEAGELAAITRAAELADEIYGRLAAGPLVGRTERAVAWSIECWARELGAEGCSFPPIVAAGAHGALPHAEPRDRPIEPGELVVLDLGCICDGYHSDATRTFAAGREPDGAAREVYELVAGAQRAALDVVGAGVAAAEVDRAARDPIEAAGHGDRFRHSTGHGVGLETHEDPRIAARSTDVLVAGNVITVEPGVYLEGRFGVRIEDLVAVTADGARVLSNFTKDLVVAG